ncbi:MAG: hypothetical protein E6I75_29000 [Chloroflexi bacterium]|nr:MAG: hypothetical protein E6I75_29000 [Chloroflexota bacterium]
MQVSACIPNFLITEYFVNLASLGSEIASRPFEVKDSHIELPTEPGLGIELDESALQRHKLPAERRPRHIRTYEEEQ